MADPYATRAPDLSGRPSGPPPWAGAVSALGGTVLGPVPELPGSGFLVVHCRGVGTLAPIAKLEPALAVLLWLEHEPASRDAAAANRLLSDLRETGAPLFAIKQGCVGGPADRPGCFTVEGGLIEAVLEADAAGGVLWERDPDFGYDVPSDVPGLEAELARALLPRLLYADNDRVYEHAGLVATKKRERYELARALPGLDPEIPAAAGWPPRATASGWRD